MTTSTPASTTRFQNGSNSGRANERGTVQSGNRGRPNQDRAGTPFEHPVQFFDRLLDDRQGDDRSGEDPALEVERPCLIQPLVQGVDDRVCRFGVIPEPLLDQAGQRRVHHRLVDALFVEQRQPGSRLTHRGGCLDRLAQDLPVALAFRVAVVEVVLLGARRGDLIEGRVGNVIADLPQGGDLRAAVDLDVADRTVVLAMEGIWSTHRASRTCDCRRRRPENPASVSSSNSSVRPCLLRSTVTSSA